MITTTTTPTPTSPSDYDELAVTTLAKQINDEYALILRSERVNLPRAIAIGHKLVDLRGRVSKHGEWQKQLAKRCPDMSYETAVGYIRLAENQDKLATAAKAKSVAVADLTIREALKLLAKPKTEGDKKPSKKQPSNDLKEPAISKKNAPPTLEEFIKNTAADELFTVLQKNYETAELSKLADLLHQHLTLKAA
jgi:hypothetical protein